MEKKDSSNKKTHVLKKILDIFVYFVYDAFRKIGEATMSNFKNFISNDDWVAIGREGLKKKDGSPDLLARSPIRNMVVAVFHSTIRQLFIGPTISVWFEATNLSELGEDPDPKDIKFKIVDKEICDGRDYNQAMYWLLKDKEEDVFSFSFGCNTLELDVEKVRNRVKWIEEKRKEICKDIFSNLNQSKILKLVNKSKNEIQEILKKRHINSPNAVDKTYKVSKTVYIDKALKQSFESNFGMDEKGVRIL